MAVIRAALVSVTDKTNLEDLAAVLRDQGAEILASSGTQKFLAEHGVPAVEIAAYTGSPELLDGRVKTLHPKIHAGILANRDVPSHLKDLDEREILAIDVVIVNLYPFVEKYRTGTLSQEELTEFIDIGGITLIRAAAKNFRHVAVVTHPDDYKVVADEIREHGNTTIETRRRLARDAFLMTSAYDAAISQFFVDNAPTEDFPASIALALDKVSDLRYGENPHQGAAVYRSTEASPVLAMERHQGKAMSYNNYLDLVGAFNLARDLGPESVSIIKHTNPCGAAWCGDVTSSFRRALATDRVSAFGGIVAVNGSVDDALADELSQLFLEVVVARDFSDGARERLARKKNLRVATIPEAHWTPPTRGRFAMMMEGLCLVQDADLGFPELSEYEIVTKRAPSESEVLALKMGWKIAKHVKSNAIVIADHEGTVGIGAGQMSRVDSSQIATRKAFDAGFSVVGKVAASDAFFPFPDGVTTLAKAGITAIVQPGGSIRDNEVIDAANAANVAMILTGRRHFRHA